MKNYLKYLTLFVAALLFGFTSCTSDKTEDDKGNGSTQTVASSFSIELGEVTGYSATFNLETENIKEVSYRCEDKALAPNFLKPTIIATTGKTTAVKGSGQSTLVINELQTLTKYYIYVVATDVNKKLSEIKSFELTTDDIVEEFKIFDISTRSFSMHVKTPASVYPAREGDFEIVEGEDGKEYQSPRNHVIKWGLTSLFQYMTLTKDYMKLDDESLNLSDIVYHNLITKNTNMTFNEENSIVYDENGAPVIDDINDSYLVYYDALVPGEPAVLTLGEFSYGPDPLNRHQGDGHYGYYNALFDYEKFSAAGGLEGVTAAAEGSTKAGTAQKPHWGWWVTPEVAEGEPEPEKVWKEAFYENHLIVTNKPAKLDAEVQLTIEPTVNGGIITMKPQRGVLLYCVMILDTDTYNTLLTYFEDAPGKPEDYLQYFTSSYDAMMTGVSSQYLASQGTMKLDLQEEFIELPINSSYHVCVTAIGDMDGSKQSFVHEQFSLPAPTLNEPEVIVTALDVTKPETFPYHDEEGNPTDSTGAKIDLNDPTLVWFLVKNGNMDYTNPDPALRGCMITDGCFLCNDEREFASTFQNNADASYLSLAKSNYQSKYGLIDTATLADINSENGALVCFSAKPDTSTMLVAYVKNEEGVSNQAQLRTNEICPEGNTSMTMARSIPVPAGTKIESDLYAKLKGEWTATATVAWQAYLDKDDNGEWYQTSDLRNFEEERTTKVTIGDLSYPQTLPEEVYPLYKNEDKTDKPREEVDALYSELKGMIDVYNTRTANYNRVLCNGFGFDVQRFVDYDDKLVYASPYDLFVSKIYSAYNNDAVMKDFGPKWFIEVLDENGKMGVPFNTILFDPLSAWYASNYYMVGCAKGSSLPYVTDNIQKDADGNIIDYDILTGYFPVEMPDDDTIIIKSYNHTITTKDEKGNDVVVTTEYFPNAAYEYYGSYQLTGRVASEITLKRGWTEPDTDKKDDTEAAAQQAVAQMAPLAVSHIEKPKTVAAKYYTPIFVNKEMVEGKATTVKGNIVSLDEFNAGVKANIQRLKKRADAIRNR